MLEVFSPADLRELRRSILSTFVPSDQMFDLEILAVLTMHLNNAKNISDKAWDEFVEVVTDLGVSARKKGKAGEMKILKALRNLLELFPTVALAGRTPELDLCASYLNIILATLFTTQTQQLQWPNSKLEADLTKENSARNPSNRPDAIVSEVQSVHVGATIVFGEAKASHIASDTYLLSKDLLRLGVFGKDAIDQDKLTAVLTFQAIGHTITFYIVTLLADGVYAMVEMEKVTIPACINDAPAFLGCVQPLLNVINMLKHCVPSPFPDELAEMSRSTLDTPESRSIICKTRD